MSASGAANLFHKALVIGSVSLTAYLGFNLARNMYSAYDHGVSYSEANINHFEFIYDYLII